jgi:hypothetical protein
MKKVYSRPCYVAWTAYEIENYITVNGKFILSKGTLVLAEDWIELIKDAIRKL